MHVTGSPCPAHSANKVEQIYPVSEVNFCVVSNQIVILNVEKCIWSQDLLNPPNKASINLCSPLKAV